MRIILLFGILITPLIVFSANFKLTYGPTIKKLKAPGKEKRKDSTVTLLVENKLMSKLTIQILNREEQLVDLISLPGQTSKSLKFKNEKVGHVIRPITPASEDIDLLFHGGEIEVP